MAAMTVPPSPGVLPNGSLSANVEIFDPAVNKKLVRCYAYSYSPPRVDWNDGTVYEAMTLDVAGTGGAPNRYSKDHAYAVPSFGVFNPRVFNTQTYQTLMIQVGTIKVFDSDKRRLTMAERWALEIQKAQDAAQVKDEIGSDPGNSAAPGGTVVNPTTKQIEA
jgi:hypothetical protein